MLVRFDSSTGEVLARPLVGREAFEPIDDEVPPGIDEPVRVGRYEMQVVPGRKGSALLRLHVDTGDTWILHLNVSPRRWVMIPSIEDYREAVPRTPGIDPEAVNVGSAPALETLTTILQDESKDTDMRTGAASMIIKRHRDAVVPILLPILTAPDENVDLLIYVIEDVPIDGDMQVALAIQALLRHPDDRVAEAARLKLSAAD